MSSKRRKPIEKVESESEPSMEELEEEMELDGSDLDDGDMELLDSELDDEGLELDSEDEMAANRKGLADLIASAKSSKQAEEQEAGDGKHKNRGKGVVYLSRIPPSMSPHQLRSLLAPYGEIGRIWIEVPEVISQDKTLSDGKAKKMARRMAKEGWVEFARAKKAYKTAKLLHCQPMGSGRFKDDLWSIKYLRDFSWNDLVNQHLHRKKMREQRLRQSIARAKQEATAFLDNRNMQEKFDSRKKRPRPTERSADEDEEDQPKARSISQAKIKSSSSESGLLGNDILSKLLGGAGAPPTKKPKIKSPIKSDLRAYGCLPALSRTLGPTMKILNTNAGIITNFEVHKLLESQKLRNKGTKRATKDMIFVEKQVGHYFYHHSLVKRQTEESVRDFLAQSAQFQLTVAEQLQIINLCPTTLVEVYLTVDDIESRIGNEQAALLLEVINSTLYVEVEEAPAPIELEPLLKEDKHKGHKGNGHRGGRGGGRGGGGGGRGGRGGRGGNRNGRS